VAVTLAMALVVVLAVWLSPWLALLAALPLAVWVFVLAFFRDPERSAPAGDGLLLSPADGRVADITPLGPDSVLGCDGVQVGIFMNVFNVHVNRSPCAGRVEQVEHRRGVFLDARDPHASERNESATIRLCCTRDGVERPIVVRQVAGLIARRIVTDLREGQDVQPGQRIGMIKFGSRLELLVPSEWVGEVRVQLGQCVRAGQTVLIAGGKKADDESAP